MRIALIGFGRIARDYVRVLDTFTVVGVVDPAPAARVDAAAAGLRAFASVEELLDATSLDAAIVATPPATHAVTAIQLLRAGCHVFCEKPLATSLVDARTMLETAADVDRRLMMASKFRFVDDVVAARRLIDDGVVGSPVFYQNAFCSIVPMRDRWNSDRDVAGGGVVFDNGTHAVDLARFLLGPIERVLTSFADPSQPIDVEDSARIVFEAGGATGAIDLSWSTEKALDHFVDLQGTEGSLQIGWRGSRYRRLGDEEWTTFGTGYDKLRAFAKQLEHFRDVIENDAEPAIRDHDAIQSVRFIEAAYRSAARGAWTRVEQSPVAQPRSS